MLISMPWSIPLRRLWAEQLHRFRDTLESLACGLRDRIASGVGETLSALIRAMLGPPDVGHRRSFDNPPRDWERPPWRQEPEFADDWEEDEDLPDSAYAERATVEPATSGPASTARSRLVDRLPLLVRFWGWLCSPRYRSVLLSSVMTALAAGIGPSWLVALVALGGTMVGLTGQIDRAAEEASNLAQFVQP